MNEVNGFTGFFMAPTDYLREYYRKYPDASYMQARMSMLQEMRPGIIDGSIMFYNAMTLGYDPRARAAVEKMMAEQGRAYYLANGSAHISAAAFQTIFMTKLMGPNCFVAGTQVLMAEPDQEMAALRSARRDENGLEREVESCWQQTSLICSIAGLFLALGIGYQLYMQKKKAKSHMSGDSDEDLSQDIRLAFWTRADSASVLDFLNGHDEDDTGAHWPLRVIAN